MAERTAADYEYVKSDLIQRLRIELPPSVKNERRLFHSLVNSMVIQFPELRPVSEQDNGMRPLRRRIRVFHKFDLSHCIFQVLSGIIQGLGVCYANAGLFIQQVPAYGNRSDLPPVIVLLCGLVPKDLALPPAGTIQVATVSGAGDLYPRELCGLIWLYSFLHISMMIWASSRV